jgi:hypothetical protein
MRRGRWACNAGRAEPDLSYEPTGGAIPEGAVPPGDPGRPGMEVVLLRGGITLCLAAM